MMRKQQGLIELAERMQYCMTHASIASKLMKARGIEVAMEIDSEYVPLNPNPVNTVIDGIIAEKEKVARDFLFAHGWDGKDMNQAREITEGYSFLEHPDHTFEIMRSEEAERLYGKPLELEEI